MKEKIKKLLFCSGVFSMVFIAGIPIPAYTQAKLETSSQEKKEPRTIISYCNMDLDKGWKLGNLSFSSLYTFAVDIRGDVIDVKKVRDDFIGEEVVKSCISQWKIYGFQDQARFTAYFVWKHGKGWVRQEISGNGFKQVMTFEGFGLEQLVDVNKEKKP